MKRDTNYNILKFHTLDYPAFPLLSPEFLFLGTLLFEPKNNLACPQYKEDD